MRFWRSPFGAIVVVLLLGVGVVLGATAVRVHSQLSPPRVEQPPIDFESMMMRVEDVRFPATDGVSLAGWFMPGAPDLPALILCHDLGTSRASMVNLAIALRRAGFSVLAFDFRGHGESAGGGSTLGLKEKRDIAGAVDYLKSRDDLDTRRIGIYGVGMGAYAAVLAAADRPALKVLVLDGLYPDAGYPLVHGVYREWSFGVDYLGFLPRGVFAALNGTSAGHDQACDVIAGLMGRDLLLLASESDDRLAGEMMRMYEAVPDQIDVDGNLVVLRATHRDGLFAEQLEAYHERVIDFFQTRMIE